MTKLANNLFALALAVLVAGASMTAIVVVPPTEHGAAATYA